MSLENPGLMLAYVTFYSSLFLLTNQILRHEVFFLGLTLLL